MNHIAPIIIVMFFLSSCARMIDGEAVKQEIMETEKAFEAMAAEKGIAEAFSFFAAENGVVKRQNDTLIAGKQNIFRYYENEQMKRAKVQWTPDVIEVSDDGSMASTYGKYLWQIPAENGDTAEYRGVFHTVWKKQPDGEWRYIWD
ncbi:MAG: YybH family protein [Bacteroidota bacterium]